MEGTSANPIVLSSGPSPPPPVGRLLPTFLLDSPSSEASESSEPAPSTTGKSSSTSSLHRGCLGSKATFIRRLIGSPHVQKPPMNTSGKTKPLSRAHDSSLALNRFSEIARPTGNLYGRTLSLEDYWTSQQMSEYVVITHSRESLQTIHNLLLKNVPQLFTGAQVEQAKLGVHGKKLAWRLTLRILGPNGSTDIEISHQLYSMNFEEVSTSLMSSAGWIGTQYLWKQKEVQDLSWPAKSGLHPTFLQPNGTPTWML